MRWEKHSRTPISSIKNQEKLMKNVLVTGGAGFIGSNFVRYLLNAEPEAEIYNLDALTYAGSLENLRILPHEERYHFVHGNIGDGNLVETLLKNHNVDTIVHFAAETHVDRSILGPAPFIETNIVGTFTLLETARRVWLQEKFLGAEPVRFHHVSTDEVFGSLGKDDPAFSEITAYAPNSPYSASKAASDHLVRAYGHTYGFPYSITNCSNNYGPYQFPEKLIPLMIMNALNGKPLPVYGDGQQVRDWLYVEDHCEAIHLVIEKGRSGETYNIGGNNQPPNLDVIQTICRIMDEIRPASAFSPHNALIQFVTDRPGHDRRYAIDITKVRDELGWTPRHNLPEGLRKTIQWYLENPDWIDAVHNNHSYQQWIDKNYAARGDKK
jgi:dTDP-glucose 4,6-dehydratase